MSSAKAAFSYKGSGHADARPEGEEASVADAELRGTPQLRAELFYRIFRGGDERLQELAVRCLLEGRD